MLLGLVTIEAALIGPSLAGRTVLLPLDNLGRPKHWLPSDPGRAAPVDRTMEDPVLFFEPFRHFGVAEVRAGRLPLWNPYDYCGSPLLAANQFGTFSPFRLLDYAFPGPGTLAWTHLLVTLVAGLGAYLFFRGAMKVGFWPAAIGAWCYPLTGFMVVWGLYTNGAVVAWLPWMLLATDGAVRHPRGGSGPGLAGVTALALVSGHAASAAQVLLASGLYFLWCMVAEHGVRGLFGRRALGSLLATVGGWALGVALSMPQTLPTAEYMQTAYRMAARMTGSVESPPAGLAGLLQFVFPYFFGSTHAPSIYLLRGANLLEGPAEGFAGLWAWAFLAPLALGAPGRRSWKVLWLGLAVVSAAPVLDLPLLSRLYQVFPLELLRNNRFVFAAAFSGLALGVMGLEALRTRQLQWRRWWALAALGVIALGVTCAVRASQLPLLDTILAGAEKVARTGREVRYPLDTEAGRASVRAWFTRTYSQYALGCLLVLLAWVAVRRGWFGHRGLRALLGGLVVGELLLFAAGFQPQTDPALYYPPIPALEQLRRAPAGRVSGVGVFPPALNLFAGLSEVRGYDGADPRRIVELLERTADPRTSQSFSYARLQWFSPRPSPITAMLGLRYLIHRGSPPPGEQPLFVSPDYWVTEVPGALPRAFVPKSVRTENDAQRRLSLLSQPDFDPAQVAYVEADPPLKLDGAEGSAAIAFELPTRVDIDVEMKTPGLVVLADLWEKNWKATLDGAPVEVLRADHALRGVRVPAGKGRLEFTYQPASFYRGVKIFLAGLGAWAAWLLAAWRWSRAKRARREFEPPTLGFEGRCSIQLSYERSPRE